ncbi:MAG: DNA polymerase III subunit gamma/tau, partial [Silvibacterium sp.]|nr:DNA polymerase III subunit gamma/tau [Silvibacterium sp.]
MAYQVLARKYRPQRFSDVAGQDHVTRTLLNALSQGRIAHGYIFSGHRGIGKTTIARILAMALNCRTESGSEQRPTSEPCGVCDSCTEIRAGNSVDVIEIDAATNRGIDEMRELRDAARYRPARDKYKIYILDEAHQITDAAFNAMLKTLEEPPEHVVFMMATTQQEDIPQTIRSRCQHFSFHAVKFDDILAQLRQVADREQIAAEDSALALLAEAGDGSMRDALSIMDQAIASAPVQNGQPKLEAEQIRELMGTVPNTVFERLLESIGEGQTAAVIEELNRLLNAGNSPAQLARQFVRYLRNALMAKVSGENSQLLQISPDERARAARSAVLFSEEDLTRFLQVMLRTFDELNYRQEQRFHLELGLIKLVHLERLLPVEDLLSRLLGAPVGNTGSGSGGAPPRSTSAHNQRPSVGSNLSSSSGAVTGQAAAPAFSPFESDPNRKASSATASAGPTLSPAARALSPIEVTARSVEAEAIKAPVAAVAETAPETTSGALALAPEPAMSSPESGTTTLDHARDAVCEALEREGHNTASVLLHAGAWRETGGVIEVEVGIKRTMLGLTMNPEAEKICRDAMRSIGETRKLVVLPGENGGGSQKPAAKVPAQGSIQAAALENPLVKHAQELFKAEVR